MFEAEKTNDIYLTIIVNFYIHGKYELLLESTLHWQCVGLGKVTYRDGMCSYRSYKN